jgi:hypothetical protein
MAKNIHSRLRPKLRNPAPYTKYDKHPYSYPGQRRLASGELAEPKNQHVSNKYR